MLPENFDGVQWNVRKVLAPVLLLAYFCGITSPFKRAFRIFGIFHQLFMFGVCILVFIHEIPSIIFWQKHSKGLHAIIVLLETYSWWTSFFFNFLITAYNSHKINALLDSINKKLNLTTTVQAKLFKFNLVHTLLNIIILVIYNIFGHDFVWENVNHQPYTSAIYCFVDFVILISAFTFIQIVNLISEVFKNINSKLEVFSKPSNVEINTGVFLDAKEIVRLRELHLFLTRSCVKVNSCFSVQILLVISISMIQIIYALRSLVGNVSINDVDSRLLKISCDIIWLLPFSLLILQFIVFSEKTSFEGRKSVASVHHLMNLFYFDKKAVKELEVFALQIKQHPVVFSVRFFDLDYPFLNTIISSLTTYFIVIVTYQGETDSGVFTNWNFQYPSTTQTPMTNL